LEARVKRCGVIPGKEEENSVASVAKFEMAPIPGERERGEYKGGKRGEKLEEVGWG